MSAFLEAAPDRSPIPMSKDEPSPAQAIVSSSSPLPSRSDMILMPSATADAAINGTFTRFTPRNDSPLAPLPMDQHDAGKTTARIFLVLPDGRGFETMLSTCAIAAAEPQPGQRAWRESRNCPTVTSFGFMICLLSNKYLLLGGRNSWQYEFHGENLSLKDSARRILPQIHISAAGKVPYANEVRLR